MKLVASITNKIISRLGARVHALASGFGFYVFAGFLVVIALLATQAVAENELDLADSITFYLTLDQMQMAYYENDSDNLLVPLQKHDAFVQKQAETEQDAIRLVHYWIGVSRFYAILAARDEFATSLQNARDWAEKASTQKIKSLLEARVNLEAAETSLMLGLPVKSMDELERISAQILAADLQLKARVHSAKAGAYLVLLDGVAALRQSRLALELFAQLDASKSAVGLRAKIRYGAALNMVDAPDSENYLTKLSEEITDYDQPKTLLLAEFFSILGVAIYGEAQAAQSANIFEALVEKANFDASHPLVLSAKMGLMMADEAIGKNNSAVQRGVGIVNAMGDTTPDDSVLLADLFVQLAKFSAISDGYEQANILATEGLAMSARVAGENSIYHLVKTLDVASIYGSINDHQNAMQLLKNVDVSRITQSAGLERSTVLMTVAGVYEQAGDLDRALEYYKSSVAALADNPVANLASFLTVNSYAGAMVRMDRGTEALAASRTAASVLKDIVSQEKDNRDTTHFDPEASQRIRSLRSGNKPVFSRLLAQLQALPASANNLAIQNEAFAAAQWANGSKVEDILAKVSSRMSVTAPKLKEMLRKKQDISNELNTMAQKYKLAAMGIDGGGDGESIAYKGVMNALVGKIADVNKQIDAQFPEFAAADNIVILAIEDIQHQLGSDTALLYYFQAKDAVFLWAINDQDIRFQRLSISPLDLNRGVRRIRASVDSSSSVRSFKSSADNSKPSAASFDRKSAYGLYKSLIEPVEAVLEQRDTVLVTANGALSSLPLSLLVMLPPQGEDNDPQALRETDWFVKKHAVITLPSISYLRNTSNNSDQKQTDKVTLLAFGNPVLGGESGSSRGLAQATKLYSDGLANVDAVRALSPLPNTDRELKRIAQTLGASQENLYLGARATETALKNAELNGVNVLAFATHGLLSGELSGLAEPALVFTPPKTATFLDDGLLTASELALLRLDVDWIIFSACNTAAGDGSVNAEGLSGLASAALYAGAKALLVSHWPVLDDAAADLTTNTLARNYGASHESRAQALRHAMLDLMSDTTKPHYAHPAAWAPFVIVGGLDG